MADRPTLQRTLEQLLGSTNVYYQPPASLVMKYPAIRYSKKNITSEHANDKTYLRGTTYEIIVIDKNPDSEVIDKLLELPYCSFVRHYTADNLNHDVVNVHYK